MALECGYTGKVLNTKNAKQGCEAEKKAEGIESSEKKILTPHATLSLWNGWLFFAPLAIG